jgi:hypothetical protein
MLAGVPGGVDDGVAAVLVELAVGLVGELRIPQGRPHLEPDITQVEDLVVHHRCLLASSAAAAPAGRQHHHDGS